MEIEHKVNKFKKVNENLKMVQLAFTIHTLAHVILYRDHKNLIDKGDGIDIWNHISLKDICNAIKLMQMLIIDGCEYVEASNIILNGDGFTLKINYNGIMEPWELKFKNGIIYYQGNSTKDIFDVYSRLSYAITDPLSVTNGNINNNLGIPKFRNVLLKAPLKNTYGTEIWVEGHYEIIETENDIGYGELIIYSDDVRKDEISAWAELPVSAKE